MTENESAQPSDEEAVLEFAAYVTGSKYRRLIFDELSEGARNPSDIADSGGVSRSHVSRALNELRNRGLVQSYGEDSRSKLYTFTGLGEQVDQRISDDNL